MENSIKGLPLAVATSPEWAGIAAADLDALLNDHAQCELKAAATALSIVGRCPEHSDLVEKMTDLAREEMKHFDRVHDIILARGRKLERVMEDPYVREFRKRVRPDQHGTPPILDQLLLCAFIEARSCERFRLLAECDQVPEDLRTFYRELATAEDRHHELFLEQAETLAGKELLAKRLREVADIEAEIIRTRPVEPRMH